MKMSEFNPSMVDSIPPWSIAGTKVVSEALGLDRCAFLMWSYRGLGPKPVPASWLKGRTNGYFGASLRRWLGDLRSDVEMFRDALIPLLGDECLSYSEPMVRLYAAARVSMEGACGIELTAEGQRQHFAKVSERASAVESRSTRRNPTFAAPGMTSGGTMGGDL